MSEEILPRGTHVQTTKSDPDVANWTDGALRSRQWGVRGTIRDRFTGHGTCYSVEHEDGSIGYYDPSEFEVLK